MTGSYEYKEYVVSNSQDSSPDAPISSLNPLLTQKLGTLEEKTTQRKPITKSGVRILRPQEFSSLWLASSRPRWYGCRGPEGQAILEVLLYTGMRYVEAQRFQLKPEWFDGKFVYLPEEAVQKHERKQLDRWIRLNSPGVNAVKRMLQGTTKLPSWWTWTDALKRWASDAALETQGLGPKTTRKTWESWLVSSYPEHWLEVMLSQGHTSATSINHYLNMPFTSEDKAAMKPYVEGWI